MPSPPSLRLSDGMILIAAIALGLFGGTRLLLGFEDFGELLGQGRSSRLGCLCPVLLGVNAWLLHIQLREPRPTLRRLTLAPGFAAISTAILLVILMGVRVVTSGALPTAPPLRINRVSFHLNDYHWLELSNGYLATIGPTIATAWVLLAIGGRWRLRRGVAWREWAGRGLGGLWIGLYALQPFVR